MRYYKRLTESVHESHCGVEDLMPNEKRRRGSNDSVKTDLGFAHMILG